MKSNTDDMKTTTQQMNEELTKTRAEIGDLRKDTQGQLVDTKTAIKNTYADLRQKEAVTMRIDALAGIENNRKLEGKLASAGIYCMAFEFQLWKSNLSDTPDYRDQLFRDAMEEFFLTLAKFMPNPNGKIDPTSSDSQMQNLMAIAATIDRVNTNALNLAKASKEKPTSILSLIEDTLRKASKVESGEIRHSELKPYEQQILVNQSAAVALLQARANFLPVMLLARISDVQRRSLPIKAWMTFYGSKAKFDNLEAIQQGLEFITAANEEIRFLQEIGAPARINSKLKAFYNNLELPDPGQTDRTLQISAEKRETRTLVEKNLVNEINEFKGYINGKGN
jgi:hypothetical protein